MENISTELGKIYAKFNEQADDFDKLRVVGSEEMNGVSCYLLSKMDENYNLIGDNMIYEPERYDELKKDWTLLKSEGIISATNVISVENEVRQIKDVLLIYFPNNKMTKIPDVYSPYIVARQGINNIYAEMEGIEEVGVSVSLDTLPTGYALIDFMENSGVLSSTLMHVYKTDSIESISTILHNDESDDILKELYDHRIFFLQNTDPNFEHEDIEDDCINGYCNSLKRFITESGFYFDLHSAMGIIDTDFPLEYNKPLETDDKLFLAMMAGGIKIDKAVPIKFDYDINTNAIKMKYFIVYDSNKMLWLVPYTESPDEIDANILYNLTEERTTKIQERLSKIVKAYDKSKGIESGSLSDFIKE